MFSAGIRPPVSFAGMKNILIINGHPDKESYNYALHEAYKKGALTAGATVSEINIGALQFDPNLRYGYRQRMELEPDLLLAWEKIKAATHIVWIYPMWWGFLPAVTKGFIDRLFLPGLAFRYKPNSAFTEKLLRGKTARIICTMDAPVWYHRLIHRETGTRAFRTLILRYCGIKPLGTTYVAPVISMSETKLKKALQEVETLGRRLR